MNTPRAYWPIWMDTLRRQGLVELAAWALEAAGPFKILGAQMLYISQPFAPASTSHGLQALAYLLEQEDEAVAFANHLKRKQS